MDCKQLTTVLDDFLEHHLGDSEMSDCYAHLQACQGCRARVADAQNIRVLLRQLPVAGPRSGFVQDVLATARKAHQRDRRLPFVSGLATAFTFGVALLVLVSWWPGQHNATSKVAVVSSSGMSEVQSVFVSLHEHQNVRLMFDVPHNLEQVTLKIELPSHVVLAKGKPIHQFQWQTSLSQGSNVLTLPLQAVGYGEGELIAVLEHNGEQKKFRLRLVTEPDRSENGSPSKALTI